MKKGFFIILLLTIVFIGCRNSHSSGDSISPAASSTIPATDDTLVSLNRSVTVTFSEAMDDTTITDITFTLSVHEGAAVTGVVSYTGLVATFNPTGDLIADTVYDATITTGIKDLAGNPLAADKTWSFTTGTTTDTTAPNVDSVIPLNTATDVAKNGNISVTFNEGMEPATITDITFTLKQGGFSVEGAVTYAGLVATFNPTNNLADSTLYDATVTTGVKDLAGNALSIDKTWSFTTGITADITAPIVDSVTPTVDATNIDKNTNVSVTFNEVMDVTTITPITFRLKKTSDGAAVDGDVSTLGSVATFNPTSDLEFNTKYTAKVTTGVKDMAGNALSDIYTWSFTTGNTFAQGPAVVDLGTAGNFTILTKAGITDSIAGTAITGNIGTSPITGASITGIIDVEVTGIIYTVDDTGPAGHVMDPTRLTTAVSNMETAYTNAAGRTTYVDSAGDTQAPILIGTDELDGGITLVPALYKCSAGLEISGGNVTLNGGENDVWIFQVSGNLIVASGIQINLVGGAQAKNVFWQVTGQTTLGGTTQFKGIILNKTKVKFTTGDTLLGRLLVQTEVSLDGAANTVTEP